MKTVFCQACGHTISDQARACTQCGALTNNRTNNYSSTEIPPGVKGWSWGAFLLNWIWAIGNKTWIGLIALIPYVGFIMAIVLGIKGREWAWKNKEWESVEHFNRVQKKWSFWAVLITISAFVLGIAAAIAIPAYYSYQKNARNAAVIELESQTPETIQTETFTIQESDIPASSAPAINATYQPLIISGDDIGGIFQRGYYDDESRTPAIIYQSAQGQYDLLRSAFENPGFLGYVSAEKIYQYGSQYILLISTGENGQSCPATTYALGFNIDDVSLTGMEEIDGCSELIEAFAEGNRLFIKKDGATSTFYNGQVSNS